MSIVACGPWDPASKKDGDFNAGIPIGGPSGV